MKSRITKTKLVFQKPFCAVPALRRPTSTFRNGQLEREYKSNLRGNKKRGRVGNNVLFSPLQCGAGVSVVFFFIT